MEEAELNLTTVAGCVDYVKKHTEVLRSGRETYLDSNDFISVIDCKYHGMKNPLSCLNRAQCAEFYWILESFDRELEDTGAIDSVDFGLGTVARCLLKDAGVELTQKEKDETEHTSLKGGLKEMRRLLDAIRTEADFDRKRTAMQRVAELAYGMDKNFKRHFHLSTSQYCYRLHEVCSLQCDPSTFCNCEMDDQYTSAEWNFYRKGERVSAEDLLQLIAEEEKRLSNKTFEMHIYPTYGISVCQKPRD